MLEKMLMLVPSRRMTLEKCLSHPYFSPIYAAKGGNATLPNGNPYPPLFNYTIDGLLFAWSQLLSNQPSCYTQSWHM